MNSVQWDGVVSVCRIVMQHGLMVLIQSGIILGLGLMIGRAVRRHGPAWQSLVYKAALAATAASILLVLVPARPAAHASAISIPAYGVDAMRPTVKLPAMITNAKQAEATGLATPVDAAMKTARTTEPVNMSRLVPVAAAGIWIAGLLAMLGWLAFCQAHIARLRRNGTVISGGEPAAILQQLCASLGVRTPRLIISRAASGPFLAGIGRPAIVLPESYTSDIDPACLRAILTHELAHLVRRDCSWTLAARLTCAVLWMQPLLWMLCGALEQAAEDACDLAVLDQNCAPDAYADCLLRLAEKWAPARRERALAAGVAPIRSALGRRIERILDSSHRRGARQVSGSVRISVALCTAAALAVTVFCVSVKSGVSSADLGAADQSTGDYASHFELAKKSGWTMQPVRFIPASQEEDAKNPIVLPGLSKEDQPLVDRCLRLKSVVETTNHAAAQPPKPNMDDRTQLETILREHPHFFYAEYLMAVWYYFNDDNDHYTEWLERSLADAPAIIAGRYQLADGSPIVGVEWRQSIEYTVSLPSRPNSGQMVFPIIKTDADGCYYIPFCHAFNRGGMNIRFDPKVKSESYRKAEGLTAFATPDDQNMYDFTTKVGLLPQITLRPLIQVNAPFDKDSHHGDNSQFDVPFIWTIGDQKPVLINGPTLHISWKPVPGATSYRVCVTEGSFGSNGGAYVAGGIWPGEAHMDDRSPLTELDLPVSGNRPVFDKTKRYGFYIEAFNADGVICRSSFRCFQPEMGIMPMPLTKESVQKLVGNGSGISSVSTVGKDVVITGTKEAGNDVNSWAEREVFGLKYHDYTEGGGKFRIRFYAK